MAIRAQPKEDTPRLAYADWLDEHGRHDRAAFIRVQIALARAVDEGERFSLALDLEELLLAAPVADWIGAVGKLIPIQHTTIERAGSRPESFHGVWVVGNNEAFECDFVRGMVGFLQGGWYVWHAHADTILEVHPIERVRITTTIDAPAYLELKRRVRNNEEALARWNKVRHWAKREQSRSLPDPMGHYREVQNRFCQAVWPQIAFEVMEPASVSIDPVQALR